MLDDSNFDYFDYALNDIKDLLSKLDLETCFDRIKKFISNEQLYYYQHKNGLNFTQFFNELIVILND